LFGDIARSAAMISGALIVKVVRRRTSFA
jgi:hypothetical protein